MVAQRIMVATRRKKIKETVVLQDQLPALGENEIRMSVDKVGLSTNNVFYAQMGNAPFLKFFSVYPLQDHKELANVPAWGLGRVIESNHPEFEVGERFWGFLHMSNVVQMKAKRTKDGFRAHGGGREKLVPAYNNYTQVIDSENAPLSKEGDLSDLAMTSAPGALSGYTIYELLKMKGFYDCNAVVFTAASSKLSLATALFLQSERQDGTLKKIIGYTSSKNFEFVRSTKLFDEVLTYEETLTGENALHHVMIDVAGNAENYKKNKKNLKKILAVGGTDSSAKSSTFTSFGPSALVKMVAGMMAPASLRRWLDNKLNPKIEMFFAPSVIAELIKQMGKAQFNEKQNEALNHFSKTALEGGWIQVHRCEDIPSAQAAYQKIFSGELKPSEAVILSLVDVLPGEA